MLTIGGLTFATNLIQGPLAGYSCAPFRVLINQYGHCAFCYTEMISAKHIARANEVKQRYLFKHPAEGKLCYQISGEVPQDIRAAVKIVEQAGADLIDLNCGCPMQKIRKKGCGSALLNQPTVLASCIRAMRQTTDLPISIKIRVAGDSTDTSHLVALAVAEQEGADFITVHGRHWTEGYDRVCRYEQILEVVQEATIPVIGNGDVADFNSMQAMQIQTQCQGIMVSRASVGRPWLFAELQANASGKAFSARQLPEIGALFIEHVQGLLALEPEKVAVLQSRKLAKYYGQHLAECEKQRLIDEINGLSQWSDLCKTIKKRFNV